MVSDAVKLRSDVGGGVPVGNTVSQPEGAVSLTAVTLSTIAEMPPGTPRMLATVTARWKLPGHGDVYGSGALSPGRESSIRTGAIAWNKPVLLEEAEPDVK